MFAGLVVLAAVVSPTVRGALMGLVVAVLGLVLLVALVAALLVGLLGRIVRRHPLADLTAGYLIGRRRSKFGGPVDYWLVAGSSSTFPIAFDKSSPRCSSACEYTFNVTDGSACPSCAATVTGS